MLFLHYTPQRTRYLQCYHEFYLYLLVERCLVEKEKICCHISQWWIIHVHLLKIHQIIIVSTLKYNVNTILNVIFSVDLVTLDDLSAEAMLESSQRIEQLADVFRRKQEPLSDPGPPTTLPMPVRFANPFKQAIVLFK